MIRISWMGNRDRAGTSLGSAGNAGGALLERKYK